jgi:hypothetical protein
MPICCRNNAFIDQTESVRCLQAGGSWHHDYDISDGPWCTQGLCCAGTICEDFTTLAGCVERHGTKFIYPSNNPLLHFDWTDYLRIADLHDIIIHQATDITCQDCREGFGVDTSDYVDSAASQNRTVRSACCTPWGACVMATGAECLDLRGNYQSGPISCVDFLKDNSLLCTLGACLYGDGLCDPSTTWPQCEKMGGSYAGYYIDCDLAYTQVAQYSGSNPNPRFEEGFGACCSGNNCQIMTREQCGINKYRGDGTYCRVSTCITGAILGSCCTPAGNCIETTDVDCAGVGGSFTPNGNCDTINCPDPVSSCCIPNVGCEDKTLDQCLAVFGLWNSSPSGTCNGYNDCTHNPIGNCVDYDRVGNCVRTTAVECFDHDGEFIGDHPCPTSDPIGACCETNGACSRLTENACEAKGGKWSATERCDSFNFCVSGACKLPNGTCTQTSEYHCDIQNGEFESGKKCSDYKPITAACCIGDNKCVENTESECMTLNGQWKKGSTCSQNICKEAEQTEENGACCVNNGCEYIPYRNCLEKGGMFLGAGITCGGNRCPDGTVGACCVNCNCQAKTAEQCKLIQGKFMGDKTCSDTQCCSEIWDGVEGACCQWDASCLETSEERCAMATNSTFHNGKKCGEVVCEPWDYTSSPEFRLDNYDHKNPQEFYGVSDEELEPYSVETQVDLGTFVTDVSLSAFVRPQEVTFHGIGMRANTKVYAFFDGEPISKFCRPLTPDATQPTQLKTDGSGNCSGVFSIPANKFFCGQHTFELTNNLLYNDDPDMNLTSAKGVWWAGGLSMESQSSSLNVIQPIIPKLPPAPPPPPPPLPPPQTVISVHVDSEIIVNDIYVDTTTPILPEVEKPYRTCNLTDALNYCRIPHCIEEYFDKSNPNMYITYSGDYRDAAVGNNDVYDISRAFNETISHDNSTWDIHTANTNTALNNEIWEYTHYYKTKEESGVFFRDSNPNELCDCFRDVIIECEEPIDPVAQSLIIDESCFITGFDVFFHTVDESDNQIFFWFMEMKTGYPSKDHLLSVVYKRGSEIQTSEDGSVATHVDLPYPVYADKDRDYAFVVGGTSPDSRVFACKLGDDDILTGLTVEEQPSLGSLFKSQNGTTWTAYQYEDLKLNVYRAKFVTNTGRLALKSGMFVDEKARFNPFETGAGSNLVRVHAPIHGERVGNIIKPKNKKGTIIEYTSKKDSPFKIGQYVTNYAETASGKITQSRVASMDANTVVFVSRLVDVSGKFKVGDQLTAEAADLNYRSFITDFAGVEPPDGKFDANEGIITEVKNDSTGLADDLNGIKSDFFTSAMTIKAIDSNESFIVEAPDVADTTGRVGGNVFLNNAKRYNSCFVSGSFLTYDCAGQWALRGTKLGFNGLFESDHGQLCDPILFEINETLKLDQPFVYAPSQEKSVTLTYSFNTPSTLISPVFNIESMVLDAAANMVSCAHDNSFPLIKSEPNRDTYYKPETHPQEGITRFKYITRNIVLREPAFDFRFFLDVHKPEYSDYDIFFKIRSPENDTPLQDMEWVKIQAENAYSEELWKDFTCTDDEFRELDFTMSEIMPETFDGFVNSFNVFKFKIVGYTRNPAKPPKFQMLRLIAVT